MRVHYTGKLEPLAPADQKKLDARFTKLSKLLDRKSEKEAHVILVSERHSRRAEITVNYYDHPLCGAHDANESLAALTGALDKLEKQILKLQAKRREPRRQAKKGTAVPVALELPPAEEPPATRIFRGRVARKPMTVDEAAVELDGNRPYLAFRDAESNRFSVLVRRPDGHLDLIEAS
ncbi:MAG: HPF/RaiA family ribosome-associated protein [Acidobacteria bacterium]|nr:HPF/RaiA family ribosome-associated protein [Acidobacteriota bacterium]